MAKRNRANNKLKIDKWIQEGRGHGEREDYKPWITIQDVPSKGIVSRNLGIKTNRTHHFMSKLEHDYYLTLEWSEDVVDIREQYPLLPLEKTLEIAESLGIKHPEDPKSKEPIVMTTDFLITIQKENNQYYMVRTLKTMSEINKRTLEKLAIEKKYFDEQGIDWALVTEEARSTHLIKNIESFLYTNIEDFNLPSQLIEQISEQFWECALNDTRGVSEIAIEFDIKFGLEYGATLALFKNLIKAKKRKVNLNQQISFSMSLKELIE